MAIDTVIRTLAACLLLASCQPELSTQQIHFSVSWDGVPVGCDSTPNALTDLRLYLTDIRLLDQQGREQALELEPDNYWQSDQVAMLDFENGSDACVNGTQPTNTVVQGRAPSGEYRGIRFRIGVPFELNHSDPLQAEAPLDDSAMHWHWRSGYKFLRAGIGTPDDGFWLHLGSTACQGTTGNISHCDQPNRIDLDVDGFDPSRHRLELDLGSLFDGVDLSDATATDCSSGPTESACEAVFTNLGLSGAGQVNLFKAVSR